MNNKHSEFSTDTPSQNDEHDGPFKIAFAWLAALAVSIAAWASLS